MDHSISLLRLKMEFVGSTIEGLPLRAKPRSIPQCSFTTLQQRSSRNILLTTIERSCRIVRRSVSGLPKIEKFRLTNACTVEYMCTCPNTQDLVVMTKDGLMMLNLRTEKWTRLNSGPTSLQGPLSMSPNGTKLAYIAKVSINILNAAISPS
jgi:hypothetical protein